MAAPTVSQYQTSSITNRNVASDISVNRVNANKLSALDSDLGSTRAANLTVSGSLLSSGGLLRPLFEVTNATLTTGVVLTPEQSGSTIIITDQLDGARTLTLPTAALGLNYKFVVGGAGTSATLGGGGGNHCKVSAAAGEKICGTVNSNGSEAAIAHLKLVIHRSSLAGTSVTLHSFKLGSGYAWAISGGGRSSIGSAFAGE